MRSSSEPVFDLKIENATLADCPERCAIAIQSGHITDIAPQIKATARQTIDAEGKLVIPGLYLNADEHRLALE
ncbi:MAG: hypothetical protein F6J97_13155 [Leptolyngbya sp. SIO4C1]|nr:hypothetical protein [Leptolyngbya sp. SIO4C1]